MCPSHAGVDVVLGASNRGPDIFHPPSYEFFHVVIEHDDDNNNGHESTVTRHAGIQ
jgi:hypothetical protein